MTKTEETVIFRARTMTTKKTMTKLMTMKTRKKKQRVRSADFANFI